MKLIRTFWIFLNLSGALLLSAHKPLFLFLPVSSLIYCLTCNKLCIFLFYLTNYLAKQFPEFALNLISYNHIFRQFSQSKLQSRRILNALKVLIFDHIWPSILTLWSLAPLLYHESMFSYMSVCIISRVELPLPFKLL